MKKYHLFLCLILAACGAETENPETEDEVAIEETVDHISKEPIESPLKEKQYFFSGAINRKYPFHMQFSVKGDKVSGRYYYDKHRKEIDLKGAIEKGQLVLDEMYKDKVTGHFYSTILTKDSVSGDWKSPKGSEMPFVLTASNSDEYNFVLDKMERTWSLDQFNDFVQSFPEISLPSTFDPTRNIDENEERPGFSIEHVRNFINPSYDPEVDFEYTYDYGGRYETENYIALFFYEWYFPGVFGIDNRHVIVRTYSHDGKMIDEKFLACDCMDRNYYDYWYTTETMSFDGSKLQIAGVQGGASMEWAEEEDMPVFDEQKDVSYSHLIKPDGTIQ